MPTPLDALFVFLFVVVASIAEHIWFWPGFKAETSADAPGARVRAYRRGIIGQWAFAIAAGAIWIARSRSLADLRLIPVPGWRLWLGAGLVALMLALVIAQLRAIARLSPEKRVAARPKLGAVAFLLPHNSQEFRWFTVLSATAGFCEELLYRGYLTWFLAPWTGEIGAFALVVVVFGLGHSYQGRKGAIRASMAGAVLSFVVLATGWLVPAMIIHALVDASGGTVGYWLFREQSAKPEPRSQEIPSSSASNPIVRPT